ncbi:hypothetical protein O181_088948 [Austropuccinia psidii MF-1]|uniref:Uncharacterized protein n=1 Tax=Austropuccinia psidii MF-1 TaxID=1389203 RepID=A0A9Q3ISE0_9BASI|nr:hypothetical protein [Austropuccinia psidii MF-1]
MTLVHKSENIHKNADGLSRGALANTPGNPAWVPQQENNMDGICVINIGTELFNQVKEIYKMERNCNILCQLLIKYGEDPSLSTKLDEIWNESYDEGIFHILDGILYHRTKHKYVMTLVDIALISTMLNECYESVVSGNLSEDRILERVKACSW